VVWHQRRGWSANDAPRGREAELDHFSIREIRLNTYSPIEGFLIALRLALYGGLVLSAPLVIYFVGSFVLPALKLTEKKLLYQIVGFGSFLFFLGVAFCYFIIMQVALLATVQFSSWLGFVADEWRADAYISFVSKFMLGMGISFQLPVVLLTMVKIGLLDYQKLSKFRTYWVVINLVICAFATPSGDPVTMLTMAIPLHILYEISVFIAWLWRSRDTAVEH
jgi:sec-independent protein translocase protein TatC